MQKISSRIEIKEKMYLMSGHHGILREIDCQKSSYPHCVFIRDIVASINDPDTFAPVQTERCTQNVNGSTTLIPLDRWFRFNGTMRRTSFEARLLDNVLCLFHHLGTSFHWRFAIVERQ